MLGFGPGRIRTLVSMATDSSHRLTMGKTLKNLLLRNRMAQSFHMLCGPMYNTPLCKCCQRCPWGPYRPRPRHVIIYHRLIMEIQMYMKNLLCNSMAYTKLVYLIYNIVMWSST